MPLRDDLHQNKDLVVALVGVVVLSVLTGALFYLEQIELGPGQGGTGGGLAQWDVTYSEESHGIELGSDASGQLDDGESATIEIPVDATNVTGFEVQLTWSASGPGDVQTDQFSLAVEGPGGSVECEDERSAMDGSLTRSCTGVQVPEDTTVAATSAAEARSRAGPAMRGATGTYTVTVTLDDTREPTDNGNSYELVAEYTDFHAQASRAQAT